MFPLQSYPKSASPESLHLWKGLPGLLQCHTSSLLLSFSLPQGEVSLGPRMANGVLQVEKLRGRRHPRELPETTLFPLIFKCPDYKPGEKTLYRFQSAVWKSI